jgi:hypothetical protein
VAPAAMIMAMRRKSWGEMTAGLAAAVAPCTAAVATEAAAAVAALAVEGPQPTPATGGSAGAQLHQGRWRQRM